MTTTLPPRAAAASVGDRTARQLDAMAAFHRARRAAEQDEVAAATSREMRMYGRRRMEVLQRQHEALVERTELELRTSGQLLRAPARTAIVAHRQEWWTRKVTELLTSRGVVVLGHTGGGAEAVGWAIAEQPDLVVTEDRLTMLEGEQVVQEIRRYCTHTVIGVQVAFNDRVGAMFDSGAHAVHVRAVPPAQVVEDLLALDIG